MRNPAWCVTTALLLTGCVSPSERAELPPAAWIVRLKPSKVIAGQPFSLAPSGLSTLIVIGLYLPAQCRVRIGNQSLEANVSPAGTEATALVPEAVFAKPGAFEVTVEQPDGRRSNPLPFTVLSETGPEPAIAALYPAGTIAGQPFNVQPQRGAAVRIRGADFLPGAKVLFGSTELDTVFVAEDDLSAWVPPALFAQPGVIQVTVRNPDGKRSTPKPFQVMAR